LALILGNENVAVITDVAHAGICWMTHLTVCDITCCTIQ